MLNVFDIAATENTGFFISYYPFVDWMGACIHNFLLLPTHWFIVLLRRTGWLIWVGLGSLKQTKKDLGTSPSIFLSFLKKEIKKQYVLKNRVCFYCQIYVTTSQRLLSSSRFLNSITSINNCKHFLKTWTKHPYNNVCNNGSPWKES